MSTKQSTAKRIGDFRASHDKSFIIPNKIRAGLKALGTDGWEYEHEFSKTCQVSSNDFARYRGEFADFCVEYRDTSKGATRRAWAGSKALAAKMREMV